MCINLIYSGEYILHMFVFVYDATFLRVWVIVHGLYSCLNIGVPLCEVLIGDIYSINNSYNSLAKFYVLELFSMEGSQLLIKCLWWIQAYSGT